jgi:hypothetical protein
MQSLRIIDNDFESSYFVTSSDWECTTIASNHEEAASTCLEKMLKKYGDNLKISPAIISLNCTGYSLNFHEDHAKIASTAFILSNIGRHDLAKKLNKILPK